MTLPAARATGKSGDAPYPRRGAWWGVASLWVVLLAAVALASTAPASDESDEATTSNQPATAGDGDEETRPQGDGAAEAPPPPPEGVSAFLEDRERFEEVMRIVEDIDAELAEEIRAAHQQDATTTWQMLRPHMRTVQRMKLVRSHDVEGYEMRIRDIRLARRAGDLADRIIEARQERDSERESRIEADLRDVLAEHFDLRQQIRRREVEQIEKRIEQLKEGIENRQDQREQIIERKIEQLLGRGAGPDF